jgi:hypothetical protein
MGENMGNGNERPRELHEEILHQYYVDIAQVPVEIVELLFDLLARQRAGQLTPRDELIIETIIDRNQER